MRKLFILFILISSAFAASQAILDIISNSNWTHDPNNLDLVVNEKLLGQNDEGGPDDIRADVLNAKFKALHLKITKISCEKEGNVYNLETETCSPPVQLIVERHYSIIDGSPVAGSRVDRVFDPSTIKRYCPLIGASFIYYDQLFNVTYTSISMYHPVETQESECLGYGGTWTGSSCQLSETDCLAIGSIYHREADSCELMNFNPANTTSINTYFYNISQNAIETLSEGQGYTLWEYEDGTPYENDQPDNCVFN